ncbi:hypothetical protein AGABI1DRAFT_131099 [Agaricus bisporus var. burnettii JB137-S8]|uniref:Uncharacterized protein n=1 Tax=Agaricus bisporus var. burnettii (strain JB137-S8 / ATCC MYA-4627 / FGSC 10392) TaxID=597362 RepID=K5X0A7_AGABU|nr:uncharacterized protein AGABI1DRAFT_131099 [Agaricus bisporus var. burnettii JB137-S8]EKM76543.1 hypothetical protein AGABI1DRAFT_131099 [Agaricus bisporus var. burnettii JB137-S8]
MENVNCDQALHSEQLLLLRTFGFPAPGASRDRVNRDTKLLDAIALLLSTGLPGDHYAVAFDKRQGLEVVLAKDGTPTSEDIVDAKELFSSLSDPNFRVAKDLYPFVARRCRVNVVKRVTKLQASIVETGFYEDFCLRLESLDQCSLGDHPLSPNEIQREFPWGADSIELWQFQKCRTQRIFMAIHLRASILAKSLFLRRWVMRQHAGYEKVERFQRCTEKLCRYVNDIPYLLRSAKRLGGLVKHRWVTDESLGIQAGQEDVHIHAETPPEAIRRASVYARQLRSLQTLKYFISGSWERTVHTCLHAELRIILHFGDVGDRFQTMGRSKPSCLCCALWMAEHNWWCGIYWGARSHYKPDATWAFATRACPNVKDPGLRECDKKVASRVFEYLQGKVWDAADYEGV